MRKTVKHVLWETNDDCLARRHPARNGRGTLGSIAHGDAIAAPARTPGTAFVRTGCSQPPRGRMVAIRSCHGGCGDTDPAGPAIAERRKHRRIDQRRRGASQEPRSRLSAKRAATGRSTARPCRCRTQTPKRRRAARCPAWKRPRIRARPAERDRGGNPHGPACPEPSISRLAARGRPRDRESGPRGIVMHGASSGETRGSTVVPKWDSHGAANHERGIIPASWRGPRGACPEMGQPGGHVGRGEAPPGRRSWRNQIGA